MSADLFTPGTIDASHAFDDNALLDALIVVEGAWVRAQASCGLLDAAEARDVCAQLGTFADYDVPALARAAQSGGNPVIPFLSAARSRLAHLPGARALHAGLTSQDVFDTALMVLTQRALEGLAADLSAALVAGVQLARQHRDTLCLARTLTQPALPTTAGMRIAQWLAGIDDALGRVEEVLPLPVQAGGAAGTQAGCAQVLRLNAGAAEPGVTAGPSTAQGVDELIAAFAGELGLRVPLVPWQTNRQTILDIAVGCAGVVTAGSRVARDVLEGSRFGVCELREASGGGSSAMPQKSNPTRSVLLHRGGLAAPGWLSTVTTAVGASVDDRADGAWHAEWPALRSLVVEASSAAGILGDLLGSLHVDAACMWENLLAAGPAVLSERITLALREHLSKDDIQQALTSPAGTRAALRSALLESASFPATARDSVDALLDDLLDPAAYAGRAGVLTDRILKSLGARASTHSLD